MFQKCKIQIVGINGFLGSALGRHMISKGHQVVGVGRTRPRDLNSSFFYADLMQETVYIDDNVDIVFYFAQANDYKNYPNNLDQLMKINAHMPVKYAIEAAKKKVKHFFYASTGSVYKKSFHFLKESDQLDMADPYVTSKIVGEKLLDFLDVEMKITSLRVFGLYGYGQEKMLPYILKNKVLKGETIELHPKDTEHHNTDGIVISFLSIENATFYLELLSSLVVTEHLPIPKIINFAGSKPISIREFVECHIDCQGLSPKFKISHIKREFDLLADVGILKNLCALASSRIAPLYF